MRCPYCEGWNEPIDSSCKSCGKDLVGEFELKTLKDNERSENKDLARTNRQSATGHTLKRNGLASNIFLGKLGVEVEIPLFGLGRLIPWADVSDIVVDGADAMQKRITATRLVTLGVFALAFKKGEGETFVSIETKSGEVFLYSVEKKTAPQVRQWFTPYKSGYVLANPSSGESDDAEKIEKLATLLDKGLITEAEFTAGKAKILGI